MMNGYDHTLVNNSFFRPSTVNEPMRKRSNAQASMQSNKEETASKQRAAMEKAGSLK